MNTVILFLLSINITASILFGIIIIFQIVSRQGKAAWHYGLMKLLLLYFLLTLVPFSVFVSANINSISLITLHLPDFKQAVSYHSSDFSGVLDIERFFSSSIRPVHMAGRCPVSLFDSDGCRYFLFPKAS